ncbi:MAG: hypothetical protein ABIM99_02985 [Candidatus Dojkabacteria bacterium]
MSYQEKKTAVTVILGVILLVAYCLFILPQYQLGVNSEDLKFWASSILTFIGISIIVNIIIQIGFHISLAISIAINERTGNEDHINKKIKLEMVEDERDHIIELKSLRFGYYFAGAGLLISLFSLVLGYPAAIMLNILLLTFMIGSIIEGIVQYYYYRKNS